MVRPTGIGKLNSLKKISVDLSESQVSTELNSTIFWLLPSIESRCCVPSGKLVIELVLKSLNLRF